MLKKKEVIDKPINIKLLCILDLKNSVYLTIESNVVSVDSLDFNRIVKLSTEIKDFKSLETQTKKYDIKFGLEAVKQKNKKELENEFSKNKSVELLVFNLTTEKVSIKTETVDTIILAKQSLNINKLLKSFTIRKQIIDTLFIIMATIGLIGLISTIIIQIS